MNTHQTPCASAGDGVLGSQARAASAPPSSRNMPARAAESLVIWHDLECGSYSADLPLWRELARAHPGETILDVGAGTGRVTLDLARANHRVIALDHEHELLAALRTDARELSLTGLLDCVCMDARRMELTGHAPFGLCVVPMQTIQLLGGSQERTEFLRRARAHMNIGARLACAIVTDIEPFDCMDGEDDGPAPEAVAIDDIFYVSRAMRVQVRGQRIAIERERRIHCPGEAPPRIERNLVELDCVSARELEREGHTAGWRPERAREIASTRDHVGSTVVMLRAA
jgi:SAM-dependent methyltransferase